MCCRFLFRLHAHNKQESTRIEQLVRSTVEHPTDDMFDRELIQLCKITKAQGSDGNLWLMRWISFACLQSFVSNELLSNGPVVSSFLVDCLIRKHFHDIVRHRYPHYQVAIDNQYGTLQDIMDYPLVPNAQNSSFYSINCAKDHVESGDSKNCSIVVGLDRGEHNSLWFNLLNVSAIHAYTIGFSTTSFTQGDERWSIMISQMQLISHNVDKRGMRMLTIPSIVW